MRSSSRRLKVTSLAGAGECCSPPRHALGSVSPKSIRRLLLSSELHDRAGTDDGQEPAARQIGAYQFAAALRRGLCAGGRGEAAASCDTFAAWNHGFVKRIIMRP